MARITIEDCLKKVPNRFELAALAVKRAKMLLRGSRRPRCTRGPPDTVGGKTNPRTWRMALP